MPTQAEIRSTYGVIAPYIRKTPIVRLDAADFGLGNFEIVLKLELFQHAGSFKTRGAFTNMLTREIPAAGVVAASGGNHGAAVAYAAHKLGKRARIFVPTISSPAKVNRIRSYGAELNVEGDRYNDALALSRAYAKESGAIEIHAFDQDETLLGQGTLGLELSEQAPDVQTVLSAVGGGGLIGGVASWFRSSVRVIGVEPVDAPTLTRAIEAGRPVDAPQGGYAADSLAPARIGELVFPICKEHVDRALLVSDDDIRASQAALWEKVRIVAEPGGAAAFAALLSRAYQPADGERVAVLVSGGNTTAVDFSPK
jgi:threonine dehydratase